MQIPDTRLVRGDLVELKPSAKRCPADIRIVSITEHPFTISHSDISDEYYHDCSEVGIYKVPTAVCCVASLHTEATCAPSCS